MANDIDMWKDIEAREKEEALQALALRGYREATRLMVKCYNARFIEGDLDKAEKLKEEFLKKYSMWGKWY